MGAVGNVLGVVAIFLGRIPTPGVTQVALDFSSLAIVIVAIFAGWRLGALTGLIAGIGPMIMFGYVYGSTGINYLPSYRESAHRVISWADFAIDWFDQKVSSSLCIGSSVDRVCSGGRADVVLFRQLGAIVRSRELLGANGCHIGLGESLGRNDNHSISHCCSHWKCWVQNVLGTTRPKPGSLTRTVVANTALVLFFCCCFCRVMPSTSAFHYECWTRGSRLLPTPQVYHIRLCRSGADESYWDPRFLLYL